MSTTVPTPRHVSAAEMTDDWLVTVAVEAQEKAEVAEAEAGSPHRWKVADAYSELSDRGWSTRRIAEACGQSKTVVNVYVRCVSGYPDIANRPTFWQAYGAVTGERHGPLFASQRDGWETPQDLFDLLDEEFHFTLDVCASYENAKCEQYITREFDGLAQTWGGVCWMNPPYGRAIGDWMQKAYESARMGVTVVCLVPARTDTDWWWDYARHGEVRFLHGRLTFGEAESAAPFPSAVVVFGREPCVKWWEAWPAV